MPQSLYSSPVIQINKDANTHIFRKQSTETLVKPKQTAIQRNHKHDLTFVRIRERSLPAGFCRLIDRTAMKASYNALLPLPSQL